MSLRDWAYYDTLSVQKCYVCESNKLKISPEEYEHKHFGEMLLCCKEHENYLRSSKWIN